MARCVRHTKGPSALRWFIGIGAALVVLTILVPWSVRFAFRWAFVRDVTAYEDNYRKHPHTCYRMWDYEPESPWFVTMGADDYARALRELCDHADPDVVYWARRTLVRSYPSSPLARGLIYGLIDDPHADMESQLDAALVLAYWDDASRRREQVRVFWNAPEGTERYRLGLYLASTGEAAAVQDALWRFANEPDLRDEIGPRLRECEAAHPKALEEIRAGFDTAGRRRLAEFWSWDVEDAMSRGDALDPRDRNARADVVSIIKGSATKEHRRDFRITVPVIAADLPVAYHMRLFGGYVGTQLLSVRVSVRGRRALGEVVTRDGVLRGEISFADTDAFARRAFYFLRAREVQVADRIDRGRAYWCSVDNHTFELSTEAAENPPLLRSGPAQAVEGRIEAAMDGGLPPFAHTWICTGLRRLAESGLGPAPVTEELCAEILGRFAAFEPEEPPLNDIQRDDRKAIEAQLCAHLLCRWRVREALPCMERLGLHDHAKRFRIRLAQDPTALLEAAFTDEDPRLAFWVLDYMYEELDDRTRRAVLLHGLGRAANQYLQAAILGDLVRLPVDADTVEAVEAVEAVRVASDPHSIAGVAAAGALLSMTGERTYHTALQRAALAPVHDLNKLPDWQRTALEAMAQYSAAKDRWRDQAAATIRAMLERIPLDADVTFSGMDTLVGLLGKLARPEDAELIGRYARHNSPYLAHCAVVALAATDRGRAVEEARRRLRAFLEPTGGGHSYSWHVSVYYGLLGALDGRAALPELEAIHALLTRLPLPDSAEDDTELQAADRHTWSHWHGPPESSEEPRRVEALIELLRAQTPEDRARRAVACVALNGPYHDRQLLGALRERLIRDGVRREEILELFVEPEAKRRSSFDW